MNVRYTSVCRVVPLVQLLSETTSRFLKTVEYIEAHDKLKCIGHPLSRRVGIDCFATARRTH
jgi:hypothetical protein